MFCKTLGVFRKRSTKVALGALLALFVFTLLGSNKEYEDTGIENFREIALEQDRRTHASIVDKFYRDRQEWSTSMLGSLLFKDSELSDFIAPQNKTFVILVWKHWEWLKNRHVYNFGSSENADPLHGCNVKNCIFTGDDDKLDTADAVVIHLQRGNIPQVENRNVAQRWIFLNDESPKNTFSLSKKKWQLKNLENVFNWSMTFRSDADVPVPYGRTIALEEPVFNTYDGPELSEIIPNWHKKRRDVLATILMSNCGVKFRMNLLKELQKYIPIDVYGGCSTNITNKNRCPGHFRSDCEPISEYLFYLVLENSSCREYLTEKIWYHAYMKGAIPIIMGPSLGDCEGLLPPNSFLYLPLTSNSTEIEQLARNILQLSEDTDFLLSLHSWRNHFKIVNEHGYFGTKSYHLCRVCEALNYNDLAEKTYSEKELRWFLDPTILCDL